MADATITLPHSDEAEQAVIGSVLNDPRAYDAAQSIIDAADFYHPAHAAVWRTCGELIARGSAVDPVTLQEAGGHDPAGTTRMMLSVPSARHVRDYAGIVREHALRRQAIAVAGDLRADALAAGGPDAAGCVDAAVVRLLALLQRGAPSEPRDLPELAGEFLDDLQARADGETDAISTGLLDLDKLTGEGGRPGELWVIGARPSMGKTALVLTLARNVGAHHRALMLTMEDSLRMLTARQVAAAGGVNLAHLRNPKDAPDSEWHKIADGVEALRPLQVSMDDQPALTLADVRRKAQQVVARHGSLHLLVIDYLQLMDGAGGENRNRELGVISNGLKRLAKELGCWVVLLSQLNREADKRRPIMSDLRDSGDIEGAADLIGLLYREHRYKPTPANKHYAELEVVKHKNGATDTVRLYFDGALQRFGNWDGPAPSMRLGHVE